MQSSNSATRFIKKESRELGDRAEELFILLSVKQGWKVSASTKEQNIDEHWDYLVEKEDQVFKVEVKAEKRIERSDHDLQSKFIWVEIRNVRGKVGWLFGKADLIAFEREKTFFFVKRLDLLATVNQKVNLVAKAKSAKDALYKIYTREGRKDKVTLLPFQDIESIKFMEWMK